MNIVDGILIAVDEKDVVDGVFYNDQIREVGDFCFYGKRKLIKVDLPNVVKIGQYCFYRNEKLTTINAPALLSCDTGCFFSNPSLVTINAPLLQNKGESFFHNLALRNLNVCGQKLSVEEVDGYCFVIENARVVNGITIYKGYNMMSIRNGVIRKAPCYVAKKGDFKAHGNDSHIAVADLQFKIVAEAVKKEPIYPDTEFTVMKYRMVTGACDFGVRQWMECNGIPYKAVSDSQTVELEPIKASDLLPMLEKTEAYGYDRIKELITF